MKNKKKILIIGALCLIIIGMVIYSFRGESKIYEVKTDDIKEIIVYDGCNKVKLVPSKDEKFHVKYYESGSVKYKISEEKNVLNISNKSKKDGVVNAGINFANTALIIEVPKDSKCKLKATTFDECSVDNSINFSKKEIKSLSDLL